MVIWDWVSYFFHGLWQNILLYIPLLKPEVEPVVAYDFFLDCEDFYGSWGEMLDEEQRPTHNFMSGYWDCMWVILIIRIEDRIWVITSYATDWIVWVIGVLPEPFATVAEWLVEIWARIGEVLPIWAADLSSGLVVLWELIPEPIRDGLQTWSEFVADAPGAIQDWVEEFVGRTIELVVELWDWYIELGQTITEWWEGANDELNELLGDAYGWIVRALGETWDFLIGFYNNPIGTVTEWLSPWWELLVTFAEDCLEYWYEIWGEHAEDLAEFLGDPMEFLWNIGEDWVNERLERP